MLYFAYGSNMSSRRLQARVPSATALGVAILERHRLAFHKTGRLDGSAKCDAELTGVPFHRVIGVLFDISPEHKALLDSAEGLGSGYARKTVCVRMESSLFDAFTYYATITDTTLKPLQWYKQHVLHGALEHGLPAEYIEAIRHVESIADENSARHESELAIYR